jgi:phage host-nuclease inhibitor protein Gam
MRVQSWEDADKALLEIARVERAIEEHAARAAKEIEAIRERIAGPVRQLEGRKTDLTGYVEAFVRAHEDEMDGRSKALTHGTVWLRRVSSLTARSWKRVLDWLVANKEMDYVRVEHEVNKTALREAPPETLRACGARVKHEDAFGYDLSAAARR